MSRALAVAGVLGAGTALVFWAAFVVFTLLPSDRLVWQRPAPELDLPFQRGPVVILRPGPLDPNVQPWVGPIEPEPDVRLVPPGSSTRPDPSRSIQASRADERGTATSC